MDKVLLDSMDKVIKAQKISAATEKKTALKKLFAYCSGKDFGYARVNGRKNLQMPEVCKC